MHSFMSLITKSVEISREFVGKPEGLLDTRHKNLIQNTLSAVSSLGTSGYFSEVVEVKEHNALPGQEVEVRSEEHSGWSLAASVFIVCLDTTLKPEVGSKNRAFHLMRSGKLEAAGGYQFLRKVTMNLLDVRCNVAHLSTELTV